MSRTLIKNSEIHEFSQTEQLNEWTIPSIESKKIYKLGFFKFISQKAIKTVEQSISLDSDIETLKLLCLRDIQRYFSRYHYIHIGCIQVAFKPLTLIGTNASLRAHLRDARCNDFKKSTMGIIKTSLCHGPVYFNVFPNLNLSLTDKNLFEAVTLQIQTHGYDFMPGSETIAVIYRIHYKVMNTLSPNCILRSDPGKTIVIESNRLTTKVATPRLIKWEEIDFPTHWRIPNEVAPHQNVNSEIDQIVQTPEGDVIVTFAPDDVNRITLPRSMSCRGMSTSKQLPYNVFVPSSSRNSISGDCPPWNNRMKPSRKIEEIDPTPSEIQEEINISEQILEGVKISEQQIPHGVYTDPNRDHRKTSPTASEANEGFNF